MSEPWGMDAVGFVEMPAEVASMENCDGRLIVTLVGGKIIDLTDWFAEEATPQ